jgi:transposase
MQQLYVGLDVGKENFLAAVKDDQNNLIAPVNTYTHDKLSLEKMSKNIEALKMQFNCNAIFAMESSGIYHLSVYQHLLDKGEQVKIFNAIEVKRLKNRIRKTKTDKLDAIAIAEALLLDRSPSYHPSKDLDLVQIRELCRLRERLVKKIIQCKIQAKRDLDILSRGYSTQFKDIFCPSSIAVLKTAFRKSRFLEIEPNVLAKKLTKYMPKVSSEKKICDIQSIFQRSKVPEHMKDICILEIHMLIQQYQNLDQQLKRVEKQIEKQVKKTKTLLLTIPGIGLLTAGVILGELGDICRFKTLSQLTAYAGLDPSVYQSGRSNRIGHISKRGSPMLRSALYDAALSASRVNPVCQQFYLRLKNKGKHHKICMVAIARKLLHIAYSVEKKQRPFYVPEYIKNDECLTAKPL